MATTLPTHGEVCASQIHTFLSLAPTTSASYPVSKANVAQETKPVDADEPLTLVEPVVPVEKARRSSSLSSTGSAVLKKRFLKLGPVHFGKGEGDWSEIVVD